VQGETKVYDEFLFTISDIKKGSLLGIEW